MGIGEININDPQVQKVFELFLSKLPKESRYGSTTEEKRANFYEAFIQIVKSKGVLTLTNASKTLEIDIDVLTQDNRKRNPFKQTAIIDSPLKDQEAGSRGQSIDVFDSNFLKWFEETFYRVGMDYPDCQLNELLKDDEGNWLPEEEWPFYNGHRLQPCNEKAIRHRAKFCGASHRDIYRLLKVDENGKNGFQRMGEAGATSQVRRVRKRQERLEKTGRTIKRVRGLGEIEKLIYRPRTNGGRVHRHLVVPEDE